MWRRLPARPRPCAQSEATLAATLYIGPKIQDRLEAVAPNLELTVDFGWLWFIANPLFWLLDHIHDLIGNWGWSIVILTLLVKTALLPLSAKAYKSMARMRKLGPEMQRLKEQYGDDRQKMSQEMMKFYQKEKINPLGGCLPILVQMPVFIALYWMLLESVELRHAPFMFWITDLSVKDPYFVLPILMGASMFVQQLLNPTPPDPTQAKIMKLLPVVFTFFFLWFPAAGDLLGGEQHHLHRPAVLHHPQDRGRPQCRQGHEDQVGSSALSFRQTPALAGVCV